MVIGFYYLQSRAAAELMAIMHLLNWKCWWRSQIVDAKSFAATVVVAVASKS